MMTTCDHPRKFRLLAILIVLVPFLAPAADRPDIVVFLSDDHTLRDSSVYNPDTEVRTPNMSRIAAEGMTFEKAYVVSPSCAPSRAAMLTGLLPQHNGAKANHSRPRADIRKLPAYLHELGYWTSWVEKAAKDADAMRKVRRCQFHPAAELYRTGDDRFEERNLAEDPDHAETLVRLRGMRYYMNSRRAADLGMWRILFPFVFLLDTTAAVAADRPKGKGYMVSYGRAWANVSNTPFKLYKHWVHEGGVATPMIAHWPGGIKAKGRIRRQPAHLIDVMATCVDLAGADYPSEFAGHKIPPMEGVSLAPAFDPNKPLDRALYFEHEGNRAVREGKWKLVAEPNKPWTLHDMATDRSEIHDLLAREPEVVKNLLARYEAWARRVEVRPWLSWQDARTPKPGYKPPQRSYPKTWVDLENEGIEVKVIDGRGQASVGKEKQHQ